MSVPFKRSSFIRLIRYLTVLLSPVLSVSVRSCEVSYSLSLSGAVFVSLSPLIYIYQYWLEKVVSLKLLVTVSNLNQTHCYSSSPGWPRMHQVLGDQLTENPVKRKLKEELGIARQRQVCRSKFRVIIFPVIIFPVNTLS